MAAADARTVTVRLAELTEHLGCVLCRGMLRDAHTIPECLHSFCKSCIYRHVLVQGGRQCPKCGIALSARPVATLISDQRLQDVVDRIFPEYKAEDAAQEHEFYTQNNFKRKDSPVIAQSSTQKPAMRSTGSDRERVVAHTKAKAAVLAKKTSVAASSSPASSLAPRQFGIQVFPQQMDSRPLPALPRPFLQVDGSLKMFELRKLVCKRLKLSEEEPLEMACMDTTVGPELSVHFIQRTIWQLQHQTEPLVLHYRHLTS